MSRFRTIVLFAFFAICVLSGKSQDYQDLSFYCDAFDTERWYRIYLPKDYEKNTDKSYPVVYYFHGHGGRYKWDAYDLEYDINFPGNGRKEPPFVMEWKDYVEKHDVIIVSWDGYEPNMHPGKKFREGIPYGNCRPYDYGIAQETENTSFGWDYRPYFKELVNDVDKRFRTIADRDHRGITGLSMGGQTAFYIAGQSKDLISSVSAFDPADNVALYGPRETRLALHVLEMHRSLKGLAVRLTMTDGDWLKYNDWKLKEIFEAADLSSFEFHMADYPNHFASDIDKQLDFHMKEFTKKHPIPEDWGHFSISFPKLSTWGYEVEAVRTQPAITLMENVSSGGFKILSRSFIPDGPITRYESLTVRTNEIYTPNKKHDIVSYDLSRGNFKKEQVVSSNSGSIHLQMHGGGHVVGINESTSETTNLRMIPKNNQTYFYFEEGKASTLDFTLVNVGNKNATQIEIKPFSKNPFITFTEPSIRINKIGSAEKHRLTKAFEFQLAEDPDTTFMSAIQFEILVAGIPVDTQRIMFFPTRHAPEASLDDMIILDGRTVKDVPIYRQGPNIIENQELTGGKGNGNGVIEPGEEILIYLKMAKGMGANDINTYHRTYLVNHLDIPSITVNALDYKEKKSQAGATTMSTILSISKNVKPGQPLDLWLRVESLYNDKDDPVSDAAIYAHKYDYRRVNATIN